MFYCKNCAYTSNWSSNLRRHEKAKHRNEINQDFGFQNSHMRVKNEMFSCKYCTYTSNWSSNIRRHEMAKHNDEIELSSPIQNKNHFGSGYNVDNIRWGV